MSSVSRSHLLLRGLLGESLGGGGGNSSWSPFDIVAVIHLKGTSSFSSSPGSNSHCSQSLLHCGIGSVSFSVDTSDCELTEQAKIAGKGPCLGASLGNKSDGTWDSRKPGEDAFLCWPPEPERADLLLCLLPFIRLPLQFMAHPNSPCESCSSSPSCVAALISPLCILVEMNSLWVLEVRLRVSLNQFISLDLLLRECLGRFDTIILRALFLAPLHMLSFDLQLSTEFVPEAKEGLATVEVAVAAVTFETLCFSPSSCSCSAMSGTPKLEGCI